MPTDFRISDLPTSIAFNNLDLMEVSQVDSQSPSGYSSVKKTMEELGEKLNNDIQYASALATTNKKIIPAINEVNSNIPSNSDFSLSGLSDTTITNPSSGQVLSYDNGKWKNASPVDVKNLITFNESIASGTGAYLLGKMFFLTYQGQDQTHSNGDTLFVLPTGLRPIQNWEQVFTANEKAYGQVTINSSTGNCNVNRISDSTQSGRIYFSVAYPIA